MHTIPGNIIPGGNGRFGNRNIPPQNVSPPVINGNRWTGQTLSCSTGVWIGFPSLVFSYQWRRGSTNIGTNSPNYRLVNADMGQSITCVVTGTNTAGSASATSNSLTIIQTEIDVAGAAAAAAFDINKIVRGAYANATTQVVRVRRSGDNAEANFGVLASGLTNWVAATEFCVAGGGTQNGFIVTVYDQTDNNRHYTQSTPAAQPQIIAGGVLQTDTGAGAGAVARGAARCAGSQWLEIPSSTALFNFLHNGGDGWIQHVGRFGTDSNPNTFYVYCGNAAIASANVGVGIAYDDRAANSRNNGSTSAVYRGTSGTLNSSNLADNVITPNQTVITNNYFDADNGTPANRLITFINGGAAIQNNSLGNSASASNASFNMQWGAGGNNAVPLTGSIQQLIIWNANLAGTRTALRDATNNFYRAF